MPKRDSLLIALGRSLRRHREANGHSQEKLAELAGLDRTYISDIERGSRFTSPATSSSSSHRGRSW